MANSGDRVKIITEDKELVGTLMPRPEILDQNITVIKLDTGYNIGIEKEKIKEIETLEPYKKPETQKIELTNNPKLPTVSIISTGGTISSKVDYKTGGTYADYTAEDFVQMMPELQNIANLKAKKVMDIMSEDMHPTHWIEMSKAVQEEVKNGADAVVLTQGTDTLHYSAAALSFMLKDFKVPIIITAAQRSIDRGSSDAFMNLKCAVTAAADQKVTGVYSCLHGTSSDDYCLLLRGAKIKKMHSSRRDAFRPINQKATAKVFENGKIEYLTEKKEKVSDSKSVEPVATFNEKTGIFHVFPGMNPNLLDSFKNYKGLVLVGTGLGHVPEIIWDKVKELKDAGVTIVITTQTLYGATHPYVYSPLRVLKMKLKCIFIHDTPPETAYVKLGWVLGQTEDTIEVEELMHTDIVGELSSRTPYDTFLN